jgi:hypothetical protein
VFRNFTFVNKYTDTAGLSFLEKKVPEPLNIIDSSFFGGGGVDLIKRNSISLTLFFKPYYCCINGCGKNAKT